MKGLQDLETIEMAVRSNNVRSEAEHPASDDRDKQDLARLGKKEVLKVRAIG